MACGKPINILLIEDNPGDVRLVELMLARAGGEQFKLEPVDRLAAGLERLAQGDISVVLVDLSLPDSHGLDSFEEIQRRVPQVPIIVMSGLSDERVAVEAVQKGAQDYLVKGRVDGQLLVRAMRYALERKRMADELARYAEALRERNAEMEADFNMAREIQQVFLPDKYPTFPHAASPEQSALRFCHRYLPAARVGGDFFNIFALTDSTAGIFICDVVGHGMRAALVTALLRGLLEELRPVAADPGKLLSAINHSVHAILRRTDEPLMATALYLIADVADGELRFANAGHPGPFHLRREAEQVVRLNEKDAPHGPALGLFPDSTFPVCRAPLAVNDLVLLFTDGVYEVVGPDQDEYGRARLLAAVQKRLRLPAPQLLDEVLAEVRQFSSASEFDDDVCLVGMEVTHLGAPG